MKIDELLNTSSVILKFESRNKRHALEQLTRNFASLHSRLTQSALLEALLKREELGSTGIGSGVAIPHANSNNLTEPRGLLAISKKGVEFNALDGELVRLLFLIVFPQGSIGPHLQTLSMIARLLRDKFVRDSLLKAKTPEKVIEILSTEEARASPSKPQETFRQK
jgi:mannitol/fructose-specific phosphotransferase system IIA component (Ntr-type)